MKKDKMIKNTCGAISLMLALLVVPFYAVAGILVEASRYQSALTGLDDAMNTSALSVLSDYDSFLQSRFGLLAMAQNDDPSVDNGYTGNKDLEEAFQKYLNAQDTTDTRSFRTTSAAAAGVYPLADTDILKAQVLDYSTLTLPTVLVSEFGSTGLQDIIKEVQNSIPGLKFLKVGSSIADTATKTLDVTKKLEKAKDSVKSLNEKTTSYDSAHSAFDDALNELKKTMGEKPGENATVDELDAYNKRYEQALENAQKAKKEYEKKLQAEIKSTESLNKDLKDVAKTQDEVLDGWVSVGKDAVNAVGDAKNTKVDTSGEETTVTTLTGQIDATKKELEKKDITAEEKTKLEQQLKQLQQQEADLKTISNAADATVKAADSSQANKILKDYNTDSCSTAISGLTEELNRVKDMDLSDLTLDDADKITKLQEGLHLTDMSKLSDSDNFNSLLKEANDLINKADSNVTSFSSIAEALSTIMSLSASYDPKLQSVINTEYYDQNFAGLPSKKDRSNSAYSLESPYEQKDAALAQADLDAIDFVNEIMDLTAWQGGVSTAASADTSKADDAKTKIGKLLNSMKSIRQESGAYWQVCLLDGTVGWLENEFCMINLPDVLPSVVYENPNATASIFKTCGEDIEGITGQKLYDSLFYNQRLGRDEYVMPINYAMAKKVGAAQKSALQAGDCLKIVETFRPYEVQMLVKDAVYAKARADKDLMTELNKGAWNIGWFIATSLSNHQRGVAMDTTLLRITEQTEHKMAGCPFVQVTGEEYAMPSAMHELSSAAACFTGPVTSNSATAWKRAAASSSMTDGARRLQSYCTNAGMTPLASEWWHFNDLDAQNKVRMTSGNGKFWLDGCVSWKMFEE